ncbi:hypothetical protein [Gordonia hongkongensis]|uniref:hypothetical protein n=1 Tax=Gordonia hongkongensis TaxID=1701090 RepID=UPI001FFA34F2|nr:hypothetical protein [Gordonia hongkongensis]UPG69340.1 hypothetical protein MVF96_05820 [Gordonia hongkongensis]
MKPDEFFDATPQLQTIRQWARARYAAPWAVFGAVLLRVAASTGPEVQLPGIIGGRASLNLLAAFVSPSGGGKGISDKVARLAWPATIIERPIGSGEGIAATFMPPKKEGQEPISRAIVSVPEIDTLAGLAARQGSVLLAQLKSAAMGEQLGQSNASEATTRIIEPHTYRLCMSVGAQPAHTGVLFNDTTGGTPQRFLWFLTIDPDMPGDVIEDPEPLDTRLPFWTPGDDGVVQIEYGPEEIAETVRTAHLARQRGDADALDGHAMLTRCKVAATLAVLHHRSVVSGLDWQLSETVMAESTRVRDWIVAESRKAERKKNNARAVTRADAEEVYEQRRMDQIRSRVLGMLKRDGEQTMSGLRKRFGTKEKRLMFDAVSTALEDEGVIVLTPGASRGTAGYRVRLADSEAGHPLNSGHPIETAGQDTFSTGHPLDGDPKGDQQKPRSEKGDQGDQGDQPIPAQTPPKPASVPRQGTCPGCFVVMPLDPETGRCEECDDPAHKVPERAPERPMAVVHSGATRTDNENLRLLAATILPKETA